MAILDAENQFEFLWDIAVTGTNVALVSGGGYDLNPDFNLGLAPGFVRPGGPARKAPLPGNGDGDLMMHVRVTTSFVANAGTPLVAFNACLAEAQFPAGAGNFIVIGSTGATRHTIGTRQFVGYRVEQLVAGNHFFIRMNPWTTPMGRDATFTMKEGKDLRYLLPSMTFPTYDSATPTIYFSAGAIEVRVAHASDIFNNPVEFTYPAARTVK